MPPKKSAVKNTARSNSKPAATALKKIRRESVKESAAVDSPATTSEVPILQPLLQPVTPCTSAQLGITCEGGFPTIRRLQSAVEGTFTNCPFHFPNAVVRPGHKCIVFFRDVTPQSDFSYHASVIVGFSRIADNPPKGEESVIAPRHKALAYQYGVTNQQPDNPNKMGASVHDYTLSIHTGLSSSPKAVAEGKGEVYCLLYNKGEPIPGMPNAGIRPVTRNAHRLYALLLDMSGAPKDRSYFSVFWSDDGTEEGMVAPQKKKHGNVLAVRPSSVGDFVLVGNVGAIGAAVRIERILFDDEVPQKYLEL